MYDPPMAAELADTNRRVLIYGAGAVGCYLGGLLVLARSDELGPAEANSQPYPPLTLLARSRVAEAIERGGLTIIAPPQERNCRPSVVTMATGLGPFELVILAVRTYDVQASIPQLEELIGETGTLLAFQNGVGTEETLASALGRDRVVTGALTVSVVMEEPGVIRRTSRGGGIALATMSGAAVPDWLVRLCATTDLPTVVTGDYRSLRWSKLLLNMLGAATSAILDRDLTEIVSRPALFGLEQSAFREAVQVMDRQGIETVDLPGYSVRLARRIMKLPRPIAQRLIGPRLVKARSGRSPGTRADMQRGKTEIGWYQGAVAAAAKRAGMAAPVNRALADLARELVQHPVERERFRDQPNALTEYVRGRATGE